MRSWKALHNLIAVSANNAETAINTEQTLDTALLVAESNLITLEKKIETNENELNGMEEPDALYDLGSLSSASLEFAKAQPQHFGFLLAYGLGDITTSAAGSGYQHVITPLDGEVDLSRSLPSFTAAQRLGKTVSKHLFASMFVDSISAKFPRDGFVSLNGSLKGTGKHTTNVVEESLTAKDDATTITLAANGVEGADDATRLQNIHRIRAELASGVWTEVDFSAASAATPSVITITAPGSGTVDVTYKVLYIAAESGWMTFPSMIQETPLRVTDVSFHLGGKYTVAGGFLGGRQLACEINDIEYSLQNSMQTEMCLGGSGAYADRGFRDGRVQTLKVGREYRDYIFQQTLNDNEILSAQIVAEGAEFDTGHKFTVALYFPKIAMLSSPWSVNGKKLAEAGDFRVFEDASEGSIRCVVKNQVATYAA